jgi:tight adherence protein B
MRISREAAGNRRALISLGALLTFLTVIAPAGGAAAGLRLSQGGGATFPARSLVLSVPGRPDLSSSSIHVSENSHAVSTPILRPIKDAGTGDFGVVLAIDVSPSMRGAPLAHAMAAARALAAQRTGKQELAVVTFDRKATVALPLSDDPRAISRALAHTPAVGSGAYIYNALTLSVAQLAKAKIAAGAVILLSDGASEGARPLPGHNLTASAVGEAAAAAHAQIYTVGLRDSSYTPARMSLLARVGGGAFIESSSSQLAHVFTQIEAGLTSAYVVHYRSSAPPGTRVDVSVSVEGVPQTGRLSYLAPPSPHRLAGKHTAAKSFWISTTALVVFACIAAFLIGLGVFAYLVPRLRRGGLRRRVGEFTVGGPAESSELVAASRSPLASLERLLERASWWARFKSDVEIGRMERAAIELVAMCAAVTVAFAALLGLALHTPIISLFVLPLGALMLKSIVKKHVQKQRDLFAEQLPAHLQELASTMRAGHSLLSGITSMTRAAPEPSRGEWGRVVADASLGLSLDEAMRPLGRRMDSDDVGQVALVAALHQRTGGNMAEVLERVADAVRERDELRRELHSLTAQARLSRYVVTALPLFVAGAVALINPEYIRPLFDTPTGVTLLVIAIGLLISASVVMRAITNIKV